MEPNTPELAQLYRCTRFPRHEVYDVSRLTTHECGEYEIVDPQAALEWMLALDAEHRRSR